MRILGISPCRAAVAAALLLVCMLPARAEIKRRFEVSAPEVAAAGTSVEITVSAGTSATDGEKVVYLQAEYSIDGGHRWQIGLWEDLLGAEGTRRFSFTVGQAGTTALVRVRVAFRGGFSGAVDHRGGAIRWFDTWKEWRSPPALSLAVRVTDS